MNWLDTLLSFSSSAEIRRWLVARNPVFDPEHLRKIIIVGAAEEGLRLLHLCHQQKILVLSIFDHNPKKQGSRLGNMTVRSLDMLEDVDREIPVIIASHRVLKALEHLKGMGFRHVAPFALLQVLNPKAYPPHMFYDGWLEDLFERRGRLSALAGLLADEMSRRVLNAVIGFRLTLDATILSPIIEWDLYGPAEILKYSDDEVYVDGGSYDGDSIRLFIDRVHGKFSRVLAFEPDKNTFERLSANFSAEKRVEPINAGLYRQKATLCFDNAGTRGSLLVDRGGIEIPVVSLDEVLGGQRVTFVKMNIEGAELDALKGAEQAIRSWGPKLAISVYHRPSHLWQVPEFVHNLREDYRLYLRQHDGGVIETVLYAII